MSAFLKIPLQFGILLIGVLVFVFFHFYEAPLIFDPVVEEALSQRPVYHELEGEYGLVSSDLSEKAAALAVNPGDPLLRMQYLESYDSRVEIRGRALDLAREVKGDETFTDVNYIFPAFVTRYLPMGVVGLLIAAIFAAAMSSIAAELNSLATATVMDFYRRFYKKEASDRHFLRVSKAATAFWGILACIVAVYAAQLGSLIEVVNMFGSFFYGSVLGVFILAMGTRWATPRGAFYGLILGMAAVASVAMLTDISFLWYNVVGAGVVVAVGAGFAFYEKKLSS